jgi:hypothetical protein
MTLCELNRRIKFFRDADTAQGLLRNHVHSEVKEN